jgi:hypothetical protein
VSPLNAPRLGIVRFAKWAKAEVEQQKVFDAAIATLRHAGAVVEELELAELDLANWSAINTILASEGAVIFTDLVARYPDRSSDHLKSLVETGKAHSATDYLAAKASQHKLRDAFTAEMSGYDAVLTLPAFGEPRRGFTTPVMPNIARPGRCSASPLCRCPQDSARMAFHLAFRSSATIAKIIARSAWPNGSQARWGLNRVFRRLIR